MVNLLRGGEFKGESGVPGYRGISRRERLKKGFPSTQRGEPFVPRADERGSLKMALRLKTIKEPGGFRSGLESPHLITRGKGRSRLRNFSGLLEGRPG